MVTKVRKDNFQEEVILSDKLVIMDFYASWCGPCKALAPILEGLAEKYGEKVKVVKVDVDEETSIAEKFGIVNVPTVIFFKGGNTAAAFVGYRKEREIEKIIEKLL